MSNGKGLSGGDHCIHALRGYDVSDTVWLPAGTIVTHLHGDTKADKTLKVFEIGKIGKTFWLGAMVMTCGIRWIKTRIPIFRTVVICDLSESYSTIFILKLKAKLGHEN